MTLQQNNNFKNVYWGHIKSADIYDQMALQIKLHAQYIVCKFKRFNMRPVYIFEIITFLERLFFIDETIEIEKILG